MLRERDRTFGNVTKSHDLGMSDRKSIGITIDCDREFTQHENGLNYGLGI